MERLDGLPVGETNKLDAFLPRRPNSPDSSARASDMWMLIVSMVTKHSFNLLRQLRRSRLDPGRMAGNHDGLRLCRTEQEDLRRLMHPSPRSASPTR